MSEAPEFSRPVAVDRIARTGERLTLEASPAERRQLAERFGLVSIDRLTAAVELHPVPAGRGFRMTSELDAEVVQSCVVTLEPVAAHVRDRQSQLFVPSTGLGADRAGEASDEVEDEAEPITDGVIDVGEAVAQQLALALPPYPRAPGASIDAMAGSLPEGVSLCIADEKPKAAGAVEERASPFAALARLKGGPRPR
ncbi:MAG: DUF177 domain-containing protein [Alphaproteobacteria bacterium]|nr:DUF177 domain-containing protein [Alphaproteobacteria bacterium]